jgi:hypothetical protein
MDPIYIKYCEENVRRFTNENNTLQCYRFLLNNLGFLENRPDFKKATIERSKQLYKQCLNRLLDEQNEIYKVKHMNIKKVLEEFIEKVKE